MDIQTLHRISQPQSGVEHGKNLVELLRLHIFREDNIVFSLAHQLISGPEFDEMEGS